MAFDTNRFTEQSQAAINSAAALAERGRHAQVHPEHLLKSILNNETGIATTTIQQAGADCEALGRALNQTLEQMPRVSGNTTQTQISPELRAVLVNSFDELRTFSDEYVSTEHLLLSLLTHGDRVKDLLQEAGLTREKTLGALRELRGNQRVTSPSPEATVAALTKYALDLTELAESGKLDPVIGRDEEIRRVMQILNRRTKNNPVLLGEPGVGKTAIVEGLAQRIVRGDVPEGLKNKRVLALDFAAMVAGAKYRGEFEERLKAVLNEIVASDGEIVPFIDELHTVVGAGSSEGAMDASNMLKPMLARGELHAVGATTLDEYRTHVESDAALERRFQPVIVDQPSVEDTISILRGLRERYETHHQVGIRDSAAVAAAVLSHRYITERYLPDKAIDLIDEAASRRRMELTSAPQELDELNRRVLQLEIEREGLRKERDPASRARLEVLQSELAEFREQQTALQTRWEHELQELETIGDLKRSVDALRTELESATRTMDLERAARIRYGDLRSAEDQLAVAQEKATATDRMAKNEVDEHDIAEVVALWTGVPLTKLIEGEAEKLLHLEERLHARVIGQDSAVRAVSTSIRRARAGLQDPNRPLGSLLFLGPTGVGKTELARALAEQLFDDDQALVRLDMSEYMDRHTTSRMIGAPPGYVGYEEAGQLTEAVRRHPYSVVLFDEVEKAHPDVLNTMLQILEDGRLTDGHGRTVDFRNTVLIMTSNLGNEILTQASPSVAGDTKAAVMEELRNHFRPELINRLDEIVVFDTLTPREIRKVVDIQIDLVRARLANREIDLELSDAAKDLLAQQGYDPAYGARPLRRVIQRSVLDQLAEQILAGNLTDGMLVRVNAVNGSLVFEPVAPSEAEAA